MPRHLTENEKAQIIARIEDGWSIRALADFIGRSKNTIARIKQRWIQEGSLRRKVGTGPARISDPEQDDAFLGYLRANPFETARNAVIDTGFPGSQPTASRRVKESDLKNRVAAKKMMLTEERKQSRLLFALNYIYRNHQFWTMVVFTDEKVFQSTYNGQIRVYRPDNTRFDERYTSDLAFRPGRFSVNVWGWISAHGLGICWRLEGRFNAEHYVSVLEDIMLPSVGQIYPNNSFVFQHDNCPVHTANAVREWFRRNNIEVLPWPAYSPDINPVENVWGLIVKEIYKRNFRPNNSDELWEVIHECWEELNPNIIANLINSIPDRLVQIVEKNGHMTKY